MIPDIDQQHEPAASPPFESAAARPSHESVPVEPPSDTWTPPGASRGRADVLSDRTLYGGVLVGGALLALSPFLSWADVSILAAHGSISGLGAYSGVVASAAKFSGASGGVRDGIVALILGVVVLVIAVLALRSRRDPRGSLSAWFIGLGAVSLLFLIYELTSLGSVAPSGLLSVVVSVNAGIGLYVGLAGATIVLLAGLARFVGAPRSHRS